MRNFSLRIYKFGKSVNNLTVHNLNSTDFYNGVVNGTQTCGFKVKNNKTVRKFFGEAVTVTQEVDDIISSPIVKESIINNSDCKILLDQRKYMNKFSKIQELLGLTDKEKAQILSINMANAASRKYKEVWFGLGGVQSAVYATEVSIPEYLTYTTEETEKLEVMQLSEKLGGNFELAVKQLAESKKHKK